MDNWFSRARGARGRIGARVRTRGDVNTHKHSFTACQQFCNRAKGDFAGVTMLEFLSLILLGAFIAGAGFCILMLVGSIVRGME